MTAARSKRIIMYIAMSGLAVAWGLDYVAAKKCLGTLDVPVLLFLRYCPALCAVLAVKMFKDRKFYLHKQDVPWLILSALTGEIGYCFLEYSAIGYLPLPIITLILACVPIVSILIEKVFYGKSITRLMILGTTSSLLGVAIIIGADLRELFRGRFAGYLLSFGAVLCWNAYNFITAKFHERYSDTTLPFSNCLHPADAGTLCSPAPSRSKPDDRGYNCLASFLGSLAPASDISSMCALWISSGNADRTFSNLMPVTTLFFSWAFFGEMIYRANCRWDSCDRGGLPGHLRKRNQDGITSLRTPLRA